MDGVVNTVIARLGGRKEMLSRALESVKESTDEFGDKLCSFDPKALLDSTQGKFLSKCGYLTGSFISAILTPFSSKINNAKGELAAEIEKIKEDPNFKLLCKQDPASRRTGVSKMIMDAILNSTVFMRGPIGRSFGEEWKPMRPVVKGGRYKRSIRPGNKKGKTRRRYK
jgi:hypothetical protein